LEKGICYVASLPTSPEREAEYNDWYDNVHLPEVVACPGFVSGRRFGPAEPGLPYIAIYEIESESVQESVDGMWAAFAAGDITASTAIQSDPPAVVRTLITSSEYVRDAAQPL
jgi:hypothetical protein